MAESSLEIDQIARFTLTDTTRERFGIPDQNIEYDVPFVYQAVRLDQPQNVRGLCRLAAFYSTLCFYRLTTTDKFPEFVSRIHQKYLETENESFNLTRPSERFLGDLTPIMKLCFPAIYTLIKLRLPVALSDKFIKANFTGQYPNGFGDRDRIISQIPSPRQAAQYSPLPVLEVLQGMPEKMFLFSVQGNAWLKTTRYNKFQGHVVVPTGYRVSNGFLDIRVNDSANPKGYEIYVSGEHFFNAWRSANFFYGIVEKASPSLSHN